MALEHCKWDPQMGDICTISAFPLILDANNWRILARLSERLTAELSDAESELLHRPELLGQLGLPAWIRSALAEYRRPDVEARAGRVMRFDFHWTRNGWAVSEVNRDVPGGFAEASELPALMEPHSLGARAVERPGDLLADALSATSDGRVVALLAASGYLEDHQVVAYLSQLLIRRGVPCVRLTPEQLAWRDGNACLQKPGGEIAIGAIFRFYQAEWLHPTSTGPRLFASRTPVCNPCTAALTESKRLPLAWPRLSARMTTWRSVLPETRDPREVDWQRNHCWVLKPAYGNTGDDVLMHRGEFEREWARLTKDVRRRPDRWIAQRRFESDGIDTPIGPVHPCIGVYTIDGRAAGIYGRYSTEALIDWKAVDVAVLVEER